MLIKRMLMLPFLLKGPAMRSAPLSVALPPLTALLWHNPMRGHLQLPPTGKLVTSVQAGDHTPPITEGS